MGQNGSVSPTVDKSTENELLAVSAISANDVWAVGTYQKGNVPGKSLTEHWNGTSWQVIPSPNVSGKENWLAAVSARATNNVWGGGLHRSKPGQLPDTDRALERHKMEHYSQR